MNFIDSDKFISWMMYTMDSQSNLQGTQLRTHIEKKPYSQIMNGIEYTYSIIPKKQKSFVFTNTRFLLLKSIQSISYARQFPSNAPLPFRSPADLPKPKVSFPLASVEHCSTQQEKLIIEFTNPEKTRWQFLCPSKSCAHEWRKKIQIALNEFTRFNMSKMQRYEDYLAKKKQDEESQRLKKQKQIDRLNNDYRPSPMPVSKPASQILPQHPPPPSPISKLSSSRVELVNKAVDIVIKPEEKPKQMFQSFKKTEEKEGKTPDEKLVESEPKKEDISAMQKLLNSGPSHYVPLLQKSASTISMSSKESIRSEIASYRRNWLDEFIAHKQQTELLLDFKSYTEKIVEVLVSQLHIPQDSKIYPYHQWSKDYVSYIIDDIYLEIYLYAEQHLEKKHHRQKYASKQFKNYDYVLESTKNEGILLVPFMVMFEFKGFTGMAKTIIGNGTLPFANKQCLNQINLDVLREEARIEPRILADQNKCKIVAYEPQRLTLNQQKIGKVYFIDWLSQFLPSQISESLQEKRLLRPQLVQDPSLDEYVFGDRERQAGPFEIQSLIDKKVRQFIKACEHQDQYFANSKELAQLLHSFGLNLRHLGQIIPLVQQQWLRKILQTQLAVRCLKNYFRFDMQNCVLNQTERIDLKEKQSERQKKRAISFLNIVLGNTQASFHLWRNLNHYCRQHFKITLWQERYQDDINIGFFLQAVQSHFKITLSDEIHKRTYFKSSAALTDSDFIRFSPAITIYNLDFTSTFENIYDCLDQKNAESFGELSGMMTRETAKGKPYLFMLKNHEIYDKICQYFLYFITPEQYHQFYSTLDEVNLPSRFSFQCHLTQIKWYIQNKPEFVIKPLKFIMTAGKKWLGELHPIFVKMNHTLSEYYMDNPYFYSKAISHATQSLQLQHQLHQGEHECLWKDYYLIGKIHFVNNNFQNALPLLEKSKSLVILEHLKTYENYAEMVLTLSKTYFALNNYRQAYLLVRELYNLLREQPEQQLQLLLIESVILIRSLLQKNHEFEAYYKFVQTDFSHTLINVIGSPEILSKSIKLIVIPYLKYVIHQQVHLRGKIFNLIEELFKIPITYISCQGFLEINIKKGKFPQEFFESLKNIASVIQEIEANNMIERWSSFNRMSNETLLERVGGSTLSRQFEFLAEFTSVLGLLGDDAKREFIFMEQ